MWSQKRWYVGSFLLTINLLAPVCCVAAQEDSQAVERVALVIGNRCYEHFDNAPSEEGNPFPGVIQKKNPINSSFYELTSVLNKPCHAGGTQGDGEAEIFRDTLRKVGFRVYFLDNGTQSEMKAAIKQFGEIIKQDPVKTALFYFNGHGTAPKDKKGNQETYLIPVSREPIYPKGRFVTIDDLEENFVSESEVMSIFRDTNNKKDRSNFIILDACRNDPKNQSDPLTKGIRVATKSGGTITYEAGTKQFNIRELDNTVLLSARRGMTLPETNEENRTRLTLTGHLLPYITTANMTFSEIAKQLEKEGTVLENDEEVQYFASQSAELSQNALNFQFVTRAGSTGVKPP